MNDQEKKEYLDKYHEAKEHGVPFFPDTIFPDAVIALLVLIVLVALAYFVGVPSEPRANPADTSYTPRPEWYFLFLFQLLKYFPGNLEFLGVIVVPMVVVGLMAGLPWIDRSSKRHFLSRPLVSIATVLMVIAIGVLTFLAVKEAPPPSDVVKGDPVAALYTANCANCHGPKISVPTGTNLHEVIAQGKHAGMPAWSSNLTSDQIDALAGFIMAPGGSQLFTKNCESCHKLDQLVAGNPMDLKNAIAQGAAYAKHVGTDAAKWNATPLTKEEQNTLLNFLVAPDGQRLFAVNCSTCHGTSVNYTGDQAQLRSIILKGGMHLAMPAWKEKLTVDQIQNLAKYVVDTNSSPAGAALFKQNCSQCHPGAVPQADSLEQARDLITNGGSHQDMPVWGNVLTAEQIDALVQYTFDAAQGKGADMGQQLFSQNCAVCHGTFGEGGPNPSNPSDLIIPISTAEYLKTRDDVTLKLIISQGQPNFGMSPFGSTNGGPLSDEQIDSIIAFLRTWEANPPVTTAPDVKVKTLSLDAPAIFKQVCAQCHGATGQGTSGPSLVAEEFQKENSDQNIYDTINLGHPSASMIAWGKMLNTDQITQLVQYIRNLAKSQNGDTSGGTGTGAARTINFTKDIAPIFADACSGCHGDKGGWDASNLDTVVNSGTHGPVVIAGDVEKSLLAQKLQGTQTDGNIMPPSGAMDQAKVQLVLDWIMGGAKEEVQVTGSASSGGTSTGAASGPSFTKDVMPILSDQCSSCHGEAGGWDAGSFDTVVNSGAHAPAVIAGDPDNSLLVLKIKGTQKDGNAMPPKGGLSEQQIQTIVDWVKAGAKDDSSTGAATGSGTSTGSGTGSTVETLKIDFDKDILPIFQIQCIRCHGKSGGWDASSYRSVMTTGNNWPVVIAGDLRNSLLAQKLRNQQHVGQAMPPDGQIPVAQVEQILAWIKAGAKGSAGSNTKPAAGGEPTPTSTPGPTPTPGNYSFGNDIMPILKTQCEECHGDSGGWSVSSYANVMSTGEHTPVIVAGKADQSLLVQKLKDQQSFGTMMPPDGFLIQQQIQAIIDWINAGAQNN